MKITELDLRNKTDFDLVLFALAYLYNDGRIMLRPGNLIGNEINRRLDTPITERERDSRLVLLRGTIGNAQWLDGLDDEQWRMLADEIMPIYERRRTGHVDWQRLAMLLLCGYVRMGTGGLEWDDYLTELVSLSERETALIENAFRDWKWLEHGQLIEYR